MKAISDFVISVFELAEAEGRDLRTSVRVEAGAARAAVIRLSVALAVLVVGALLLGGGAWLMLSGLHLWLETQVSRPLAAVLAGLSVFGVGVGCLVLFRSMIKRRRQ
jgi:hypothetical protein